MAVPDEKLLQALRAPGPTGPRALVHEMEGRLRSILRRKHPLAPTESIEDAATDALLEVINRPGRVDLSRGSLMNFLVLLGHRTLIDGYRKAGRRPRITLIEDVEDHPGPANEELEMGSRPFEWGDLSEEWRMLITHLLPDPKDQELLKLMCEDRRDTSEFAEVLGMGHLPLEEQRKQAKRHRDRILKRLQRREVEFRNLTER